MLITFSGLDGSGKSSLIAWLKQELERRQLRVTVLHLNDHVNVYAHLRALRGRMGPRRNGHGRIAAAGWGRAWHALRDAIVWSQWLRRLLYPVDLLIFLACRLYVERWRGRVLIMDRYFYDTLVDVADGRRWRLLRWLERLTPTPDVAVLMDVTPEESHARKAEYPVAYLARRWRAYRTVFHWVGSGVLLPNRDPGAARRAVARLVEEQMK